MTVFSKIKNVFYKHKVKFTIGGIIIGTIFLLSYAQKFIRQWHEQETIEFIERNRKQSHFESTNRTCNQTILNLSGSLLDEVYQSINTDQIIEGLKKNPENKLDMWNSLKNQVFTKSGCIVYSIVMLVMTLKLQLNIVGGYLYRDSTSVTPEIQEKYLSLCQHFLTKGIKRLANCLQLQVDALLDEVELKKQMKLSDIEALFWSLQVNFEASDGNPVNNFRSYIFPMDVPTSNDTYSDMLRDTADLLESEEVKCLLIHHVNRGFMLLGDQLSEFFVSNDSREAPKANPDEFQNPFGNKKPLAKLLPILNGLLSKQSLPQNLMQDMISNHKLQALCANVYESLLL